MNDDREARLLARFNDAQERILERISAIEATLQSIDETFMKTAKGFSALSSIDEQISQRVKTLEDQNVADADHIVAAFEMVSQMGGTEKRLLMRVGALEENRALGVRR